MRGGTNYWFAEPNLLCRKRCVRNMENVVWGTFIIIGNVDTTCRSHRARWTNSLCALSLYVCGSVQCVARAGTMTDFPNTGETEVTGAVEDCVPMSVTRGRPEEG